MLECLIGRIGITQSECECLLQGLSSEEIAALRVSSTGRYLDDVEDAVKLDVLKEVDACKDFAKLATDARNDAVKQTEDDLIKALSTKIQKDAPRYMGNIGKPGYSQSLADTRQFQGIRILGNEITDGEMKINKLRIVGNASGSSVLKIVRSFYKENEWEVLHTLPFTAVANNFVDVALPSGGIVLPFGKNFNPYDYRIYYDTDLIPGFFPKDTKFKTCSGCDKFDGEVLETYGLIEGISFLSEANYSAITTDDYSHGIVIDCEMDCKTEVLICRSIFLNQGIEIATNWAIMYKANEILIEKIFQSPEINRLIMQKNEYLWGKRNHFRAEYQNNISWIVQNIKPSDSDCFTCRQNKMFKKKVVS